MGGALRVEAGHQSRVPQQVLTNEGETLRQDTLTLLHFGMVCRYRCWMMVWKAWTSYTVSYREKKQKKRKSDKQFSHVLMRRAWRGWVEYVRGRRAKKEQKEFCCEWHVERTMKRCWQQWQHALSMRVQGRAMDIVSLHYWAIALERRVSRSQSGDHVTILGGGFIGTGPMEGSVQGKKNRVQACGHRHPPCWAQVEAEGGRGVVGVCPGQERQALPQGSGCGLTYFHTPAQDFLPLEGPIHLAQGGGTV